MATATKKRQKPLPGMEQPKNAKIEKLADQFVTARDEWQALRRPMTTAQDKLYVAMQEAKIRAYELPDGSMCEIVTGKEKVRVRKPKSEDDEDE